MTGPRVTRTTFPDPRPPEARERGGLVRWRIALKMAVRESRRSWPSSVLVMLLVFLPIAGVSAAAVYASSLQPSLEQRIDAELGHADAWVQAPGASSGMRQYLDEPNSQYEISPGSSGDWIEPPVDAATAIDAERLVRIARSTAVLETSAGFGNFDITIGDAWDPLLEGRYTLLDGRTPASPTEMLATPEALARLGAALGDEVVGNHEEPSRRERRIDGLRAGGSPVSDRAVLDDLVRRGMASERRRRIRPQCARRRGVRS
jgi:putative ABC transport system permease protein